MTGLTLKLIAVVTMFIDHSGAIVFPGDIAFRYIGRLAFPLFCFLLTEGFIHTKNLFGYMIRLLVFAVISEVPFDWGLYGEFVHMDHQNVFWTLLLGLMAISCMELVQLENIYLTFMARCVIAVPYAALAQLFKTDYRAVGVLLIVSMYLLKRCFPAMILAGGVLLSPLFSSQIEICALLSYIPMYVYNGERGRVGRIGKWGFYVFYPLHFVILGLIRDLLWT